MRGMCRGVWPNLETAPPALLHIVIETHSLVAVVAECLGATVPLAMKTRDLTIHVE